MSFPAGIYTYGLWRYCSPISFPTRNIVTCKTLLASIDFEGLDTCRAFMVLAVIISFAATIVAIVHLQVGEEKVPIKIIAVLFVITGVFTLIALSKYTDIYEDLKEMLFPQVNTGNNAHNHGYYWGYAFGWIATVIAFLGAGFVFLRVSNNAEAPNNPSV